MASRTTYLLVSNSSHMEAVQNHSVIEENGFELRQKWEEEEKVVPSLKFVSTTSLEEAKDLETSIRTISSAFPDATFVLCTVEERFNQIDHLQTMVFINGRRAGEFEQGYILNIGS